MKPTILHVEPHKTIRKFMTDAFPQYDWIQFGDHQKANRYLSENHGKINLVMTHVRSGEKRPGEGVVATAAEYGLPTLIHAGIEDDWHALKRQGMHFLEKPSSFPKMLFAIQMALGLNLPNHVAAFVPDKGEHLNANRTITENGVAIFSKIEDFKNYLSQNGDLLSAVVVDQERTESGTEGLTAIKHAVDVGIPVIAWAKNTGRKINAREHGAKIVIPWPESDEKRREFNDELKRIRRKS